MSSSTKQLYQLRSACGGNWRNCITISAGGRGYLLTADRDAKPILMPVERFQQFTGVQIDPTECCGQLSETAVRTLYSQYFLWRMHSAEDSPFS